MKLSVRFTVPCAILLCTILKSCTSEEILTDRPATYSPSYSSPIGPFRNILVLWRTEAVNMDRLKKFETALKAKCAKHGTVISFIPYKTEDSAFSVRLRQLTIANKTDFIIRLSHSGQFMRKTVQDPFIGIRQKNSFRVERVSFSTVGYYPADNKPVWKGTFSVISTSIPAVDEQAVTRLYNRMLMDGVLQ